MASASSRQGRQTCDTTPTSNSAEVFKMTPQARVRWLREAFKGVAEERFDSLALLDIEFLENVTDPAAGRIYGLLRANQLKLKEEKPPSGSFWGCEECDDEHPRDKTANKHHIINNPAKAKMPVVQVEPHLIWLRQDQERRLEPLCVACAGISEEVQQMQKRETELAEMRASVAQERKELVALQGREVPPPPPPAEEQAVPQVNERQRMDEPRVRWKKKP
eukprot:g13445.t1